MPEPIPSQDARVYAGHSIIVNRLLLGRGRGTHLYEVRAREDGTCLALIQWYGPWRTYVLQPKNSSIWESRCLRDIVAFLEELQRERKKPYETAS